MYILCESKNKSKLVCYQEFAYYVLYKQHGNSFVRQRKRRKLLPLLTNKGEDYKKPDDCVPKIAHLT